jgi:hypothetical protein
MSSSGWSNVQTRLMWTHISNDNECYQEIHNRVKVIYTNHSRCSVFSRRAAAVVELAEYVKSLFNSNLDQYRWFRNMPPWSRSLFKQSLDGVKWQEMARVLIQNHEYTYNVESPL